MREKIFLHNQFFTWEVIKKDEISYRFKGHVFLDNQIISIEELVDIFPALICNANCDREKTNALLQCLNGNFALIIETSNFVFCSVDRVRSIPLFYGIKDDSIIISDDANYLRKKIDPPFNEEAGAEFLVTGYVTGNETLFEGIYQIQAGEYLIYNKADGSLKRSYYHRYLHGNHFSDPEEVLLDRLDDVMIRVFQRLIETTKGKQLVVPLSGGLDSRIIVAMLKRLGVDDVICFSYGKKGNREAEISRQVAEVLGYKWFFVEYTKEKLYNWYNSDKMREYFDYAGNLTSLPHIQDYFAINELKTLDLIPKDSVFVPGHSGDMLAGSWIPYESLSNFTNANMFIEHTLNRHYSLQDLQKMRNEQINSIFLNRIRKSINDIDINNCENCIDAIELFNFSERQAKFIVNSIRAYEFFGYQWRIPLWDNELIDFFSKVQINYRILQYLYIKYIYDLFFLRYFPELINIPTTKMHREDFSIIFLIIKILKEKPLKKYFDYFYNSYKKLTEYSLNPMNYYGIMSKKDYSSFFESSPNINSFLANQFIVGILNLDDCSIFLDEQTVFWSLFKKLKKYS